MSYLFDLSERIYKVNRNIANSSQSINTKKFEKSVIDKFVLELNNKLNIDKLFFESTIHYQKTNNKIPIQTETIQTPTENRNAGKNEKEETILYLILNINGNVLNIFSAKVEIGSNGSMSFKDIKWQYNLSTDFMNYVYNECKKTGNFNKLFYDIMLVYYEVVEQQLRDFIDLYNSTGIENLKQYIFFYNVYVQKKIFKNLFLLDKFKNNNFISFYESNYYETFLLLIDEDIFNKDFELNIKIDLYFFFIFFIFSTTFLSFGKDVILTIDLLKTYMLDNLYNFIFSNTYFKDTKREAAGIEYKFEEKNKNNIILKSDKKNKNNSILTSEEKNKNNSILTSEENNTLLNSHFENIIKDKKFLFLLKYTRLVSLYYMWIDYNFFKKYGLRITPATQNLINIINTGDKTINYNNSGETMINLGLFNLYFFQEDNLVSFSHRLEENEKKEKKKVSYSLFLDYKNNFANIKIKIDLKSYLIKILGLCINKKIGYNNFIICLINFLIKIDKQYLEYFYNIIYNYLKESKLPESIMEESEGKFYSEENSIFDMLIISYNERNHEFDIIDCLPILYKVTINQPSFIVIGTHESGSMKIINKILSEATHYPHVLGKYLENLGYSLLDKIDGTMKNNIKSAEHLRLRVYYNNRKVGNEHHGKNITVIKKNKNTKGLGFNKFFSKVFTSNKIYYKGTLFFEMIITIKTGEERKIVLVNTNFSDRISSTENDDKKKYFLHLMKKKIFTDEKSLIQLYREGYNIIFMGNLSFEIPSRSNIGNKSENKFLDGINGKNNFSVGINQTNQPKILYALQTLNSKSVISQKYDFPDKNDRSMVSLSLNFSNKKSENVGNLSENASNTNNTNNTKSTSSKNSKNSKNSSIIAPPPQIQSYSLMNKLGKIKLPFSKSFR
jgi:hypothetical protein